MSHHLRPNLARRIRLLARTGSLFAAALFIGLAIERGPPVSPEGEGIERDIQYVFVGVGVFATTLAWRFPAPGGLLLTVAGAVLGVAAAGRFPPLTALGLALLFIVPGVLFLMLWVSERRFLTQALAATFVVGLLALGGQLAMAQHDNAFGPQHPGSDLKTAPVDAVEWVWAGGVTSTGATVKAKLAVEGGRVRLVASTAADLSSPVSSPAATASNGNVAKLTLSSLASDTIYYYAVEVDGVIDAGRGRGRFRTFPEGPASFRFAVGACARSGSNGAVFDTIRESEPLLYLSAGDLHYENIDRNDRDAFRDAYDRQLSQPAQAALYASTAFAYTWDDHDYGPNNSDGRAAGREAARLTYREYVPHYDLPGGDGDAAIYQAFSVGSVRFILLDTRSERGIAGADSLLGPRQLAWLKTELTAAAASHTLVVLVSSVPWIADASPSRDDWGGYAAERQEISDFVAGRGIDNLLMIAGDAHMLAIDDGRNSGYAAAGGAGFPVFHAAALDRPGSEKGGPYSEGAFPGAGQFGLVSVTDDGLNPVRVDLSGRDWTGKEIVAYSFTLSQPAP